MQNTVVGILCGGQGTRLWPKSTRSTPKQFLCLFGGRTLLDHTIDRAMGLVGENGADHVWLIGSQSHVGRLKDSQARIRGSRIIMEPKSKNTAPAIATAIASMAAAHGDPTVVISPSDHYIGDPEAFLRSLEHAVAVARDHDALVILGVKPISPETGFGYIELGAPLEGEQPLATHHVAAFREKPDLRTAISYLTSGRHMWNAGVFVARASHFTRLFKQHAAEIGQALPDLTEAFRTGSAAAAMESFYAKVPAISFDHAVVEHAQDVMVVQCDAQWSDAGSWNSVWEIADKDRHGNVATGDVLSRDTDSCVILGGMRKIVTLGVSDLVIVDNGRTLLVADRDRSQELGHLVNEMATMPGWADCL